ncbi:MAG TPA: MlaD family protein [Candidatus Acidoferrales bacterium]|nr:MlaD family protein [Candidatus Acidoferrales bacterium]
MSRRTEIQVGLTVLVALVVLLWGVTWLKDLSLQRRVTVWHVRFPQTGGLGASDEVLVNGIRKGAVSDLHLDGDAVIVDLALDSDVRLTSASRVAIRNVGLMGEKVIAVDLRTSGVRLAPRDTVSGIYELGMGEVMADVGTSMAAVDRVVGALDGLANRLDRNGNVDQTTDNLRKASEQLAAAVVENRKLVHETLENADAVSKTARAMTTDRQAQYVRMVDAMDRTTHNVEALSMRLDSLRATMQSIADKADHGDGSVAQLLNDRALYDHVRDSAKALQDLLEDVKKHPRKYLNLSIF